MTSSVDSIHCIVPLQIIIIGGGLAGLSTAVSLGSRGYAVLVLESTKELQTVGAGIGMPPTIKQWYESEQVFQLNDPVWASTEGFEIRRWDTGEQVARTVAPPIANPVTIHRADLQSALFARAQKLEKVEVRLGSRVVDIDTDAPTVHLATGERIGGDLIIVADGVNSTLKWKICPSESETAQSTGDAAYRFVLPRRLLEENEELKVLVDEWWVKRWDGPGGHVIAYPIHNRELLNVVLIHPDDDQAEESWVNVTEKQHVIAAFQGWDPVLQKLMELAPTEVPHFRILTHSPLQAWVNGQAILLGDSCHAMPPHLSQGVSQAVEDSIAITAVLLAIESKQQLSAALRAYESSRKGRVEQIQVATAKARQFAYRKDNEAQAVSDKGQTGASEAKGSQEVLKLMRASWNWDAAEAARRALSDILKSA